MNTKLTTVGDLASHFTQLGAQEVNIKQDLTRGLSSKTARAIIDGRPALGVAGDWKPDDQLGCVADALAWLAQDPQLAGAHEVDLYVACGSNSKLVNDSVRLLVNAVAPPYKVNFLREVNAGTSSFSPDDGAPAVFDDGMKDSEWYTKLKKNYEEEPNPLAVQLKEEVANPQLSLYPPNVSDKVGTWRIRLGGLEIGFITLDSSGEARGQLGIGGESSTHKAVAAWNKTGASGKLDFDESSLSTAVRRIKDLNAALQDTNGHLDHGLLEHQLEAEILRRQWSLQTAGGTPLDPISVDRRGNVVFGSQFPTMWTPDGHPRYLDALLVTEDKKPFAVELKVAKGNGGRYLRGSLHQALLYAHYLTHSPAAQTFMARQGIAQGIVRPAVYWRSADRAKRPTPAPILRDVAEIMGVEVLAHR